MISFGAKSSILNQPVHRTQRGQPVPLFRKKKLFEYDPKELDLEMLSHLQGSLVAKLILVNKELIGRYRSLVELGEDLPSSSESREVLSKSAYRLEKFVEILEDELARIQE